MNLQRRVRMAQRLAPTTTESNMNPDNPYKNVPRLDYTRPPPELLLVGAPIDVPTDQLSLVEDTPAEALAAAWIRWKAANDPPGMQLHHLTDLADEPWVVQVFDCAAEHLGPGGINGFREKADARNAAWLWHDERHALQAEIDDLRRLWATTPGIHYTEADHDALAWPEVLGWCPSDVLAIKEWLAEGATTAPPPTGPRSLTGAYFRRHDEAADVYRQRDLWAMLAAKLAVAAGYQAGRYVDPKALAPYQWVIHLTLAGYGQITCHTHLAAEPECLGALPVIPRTWDGHSKAEGEATARRYIANSRPPPWADFFHATGVVFRHAARDAEAKREQEILDVIAWVFELLAQALGGPPAPLAGEACPSAFSPGAHDGIGCGGRGCITCRPTTEIPVILGPFTSTIKRASNPSPPADDVATRQAFEDLQELRAVPPVGLSAARSHARQMLTTAVELILANDPRWPTALRGARAALEWPAAYAPVDSSSVADATGTA